MVGVYNGFSGTERMKAYRFLMAEVSEGRRSLPTRCDSCLAENCLIQPHSEDYSIPYGANVGRWGLCYRCHMILHCRFSNPHAWVNYCSVLKSGRRFDPFQKQSWGQFVAQHLGARCTAPIVVVDLSSPLPGFSRLLTEGLAVAAREPL